MPSLATWNINSVRLRMPLVLRFLKAHPVDVLCLQEIKCETQQFPFRKFARAGYPHHAVHGQKGYHGVAIVSSHPLTDISRRVFCEIEDCRHVSAGVDFGHGPLTVHSIYIPAGGDEPDPAVNRKFKHKLDFLAELKTWFGEPHFKDRQLICCNMKGGIEWMSPIPADNMKASRTGKLTAVWGGKVVQIIDERGTSILTQDAKGDVISVSVGETQYAVVTKEENQQRLYLYNLKDGKEVAVKVLRPGMRDIIDHDIGLMHVAADWLERLWADGRRLKAKEVVGEFDKYLHDELDLMREAANASQLRRNFAESTLLMVPEMYWDYCSPSVIVSFSVSPWFATTEISTGVRWTTRFLA